MAERNIRLVIEYEGTRYAGWQVQNGQATVQGALLDAIEKVTSQRVNLLGAGRTDTGVHALGQVANFRIDHRLEPERYSPALNYYLPDDIHVKSSEEVAYDFHARFDAKHRRYRYLVSREKSAIYRHLRYYCRAELDYDLLRKAADLVIGKHDFAPFCVTASRQNNNVCEVAVSKWYRMGPLLIYEVRANRFLHSMVRTLVGGMLNLALVPQDDNRLNLTLDRFRDIIDTRLQERVPFTAPACGLYLVSVGY